MCDGEPTKRIVCVWVAWQRKREQGAKERLEQAVRVLTARYTSEKRRVREALQEVGEVLRQLEEGLGLLVPDMTLGPEALGEAPPATLPLPMPPLELGLELGPPAARMAPTAGPAPSSGPAKGGEKEGGEGEGEGEGEEDDIEWEVAG
jgi:hypothetical protein